ncbi:murein biosynthesis integral membrane protein MurJ [Actinacidiphila yeochonensis]|uniref:murein biosynthesis integral membrane protein MurJ n=1 Tax=Actinacidiphila yeochonensis TaxID=89050 RepID=UPI00056CACDD|nr:murein biosynthesis integral membrane protein MurJ [Actinacidiphila yeochonensis]
MNAPYDGDRDSAGRPPHSADQQPSPHDPYVQGTYAYDPYPHQGTGPGPAEDGFYDQDAQPPHQQPYGGQHWQQTAHPHMPYGDNPAMLYVGVDDLGQTGGMPVFDAYEHLFRDQRTGGGQPEAAPAQGPGQQGWQQGYQQPYPQQQDPRYQQGYPQDPQQAPHGYPQQDYQAQGYQQQPGEGGPGYGYGDAGYSQPTTYHHDQPYPQQGYADPHHPAGTQQYGQAPYEEQTQYAQGTYAPQGYGPGQAQEAGYADPRYVPEHPQVPQPEPVDAGEAAAPAAEATGPMPVTPAPETGARTNILKSSALMAAGTLVSRVTGFVRTLVIAAAIGLATLGDSYAVANTLPTMIYILTIGGGLNSVFVPQLARAMKDDDDGGAAYANRLLTVVMVALGGIVAVTVVGAPLLIKIMSPKIAADPDSYRVAIAFARYCMPTIFFMGVHVVMGQVLNARGRFGAMMWTPVLNNLVVIFTFGMFIWVYGPYSSTHMDATTITPQGVRLLGLGTLLGLVVQSLSMLPYLRDAGFKFRPRFDWRGHGLGKTAKLAKWTFFFVLANQAGLIVVTQLATWGGINADKSGYQGTGITAYNNALLIWQMPQAIITVSVMAAVLPRISRAAADGDVTAVRDDISYGLRTSAVAIVPAGFAFLTLGVPMCSLLYASTGTESARNIGFILMAFGVGLIPFSAQYVLLRGFYAFEDTRTPFYNTVVVAAVNAAASIVSFVVLPNRWAVTGMAFSYGLAYAVGVGVAAKRLRARLQGDLDGRRVMRTYARLAGACIPASLVAGAAVIVVFKELGSGATGALAALVVGGCLLLGLFVVTAKRMRIQEMTAMIGMVRGRLGR